MIEEAKLKIREEMEKNKDNQAIAEIGKFLLANIEVNKKAAEDINSGKKSIEKSLKHMEQEALKMVKNKSGHQCVCIPPEGGFDIVKKYFEFEAVQDKIIQVEVAGIKEDHNIHEPKKDNAINVDFNVSLEDLF